MKNDQEKVIISFFQRNLNSNIIGFAFSFSFLEFVGIYNLIL